MYILLRVLPSEHGNSNQYISSSKMICQIPKHHRWKTKVDSSFTWTVQIPSTVGFAPDPTGGAYSAPPEGSLQRSPDLLAALNIAP